ncbi:MAG: hypothetical protein KGI50_07575 [Patescibacteria group bacterium]|nr:hypothetical protein [Patescibacteria group bacterium]
MAQQTQSGQMMPPGSIPEGSSSKAIQNAINTSRDGWNRSGNLTPDQALQHDKNMIRKNVDPSILGPNPVKTP